MSNTKYRVVIKFFTCKRLSATEIIKEFSDVYSDSAPSYHSAAKWVAEFNDLTRAVEGAPQSNRPPAALANESIRVVEEVMMRVIDKLSVRHVADELDISATSLDEIISDYLEMKKVCMRWVLKPLTPLQRAN